MEKYKNEDYLKKGIMEQSRHLFIYGYNNKHRSEFLKDLESEYPIIPNSDKPAALYFDSLGIPKMDVDLKDRAEYLIHAVSKEYLSFMLAAKILEKSMDYMDGKLSRLICLINRKDGNKVIETTTDLLKEIKISRDFYYESYINYVNGLITRIPINNIAIPFLELRLFVKLCKEAINMDSYFGFIFDKKSPLMMSSTQAINYLVGGRINKDISVKVAIEPNDWDTYSDFNGQFIEATHDYGTIELDNSFSEHMKVLKKKYNRDYL